MRRTGSFPSSSSSSDFEFTVSLSPSSKRPSSRQCPADELFYKGQILPLHLSPRISMVRTLLLASSSTSSSSTATTTASRDSNGSSSSSAAAADLLLLLPECDSSRPSSVTEEEEAWRAISSSSSAAAAAKRGKYFSSLANRFSSVFLNRGGGGSSKKDHASSSAAAAAAAVDLDAPPTGKRANATAKQVIKKYVSKVKPLYEKLKNPNPNPSPKKKFFSIRREKDITLNKCDLVEYSMNKMDEEEEDHGGGSGGIFDQSHSFSGNLRYHPRRKRCTGSCLSSMRSSPAHPGAPGGLPADPPGPSSSSSMEELQSAIQGAIAHCKSTMVQPEPKKNIPSEPQDLLMNCSLNVTSVH